MINILDRPGIEENLMVNEHNKGHLWKNPSQITLTDEWLKVFPRLGTKWGCPLTTILFNIVLKALAIVIRQEKNKIKGIRIEKEEAKLFLLTDGMILHTENPK